MDVWTTVAASLAPRSSRRWSRLLVVAALSLPGCGMHSEAGSLALARKEIQAKDYATAIVRLKDILQHDD